jgi:hypothetical protein
MLSLGSKAYDKPTLQCVAHYTLSQFAFTYLYHRLLRVSLCVVAFDDDIHKGRIRRRQRQYGGGQAHHEAVSLLSRRRREILRGTRSNSATRRRWTILRYQLRRKANLRDCAIKSFSSVMASTW